jgi:hypothetical protein
MRYSRLKKKLDEMEASNEEAHGKDKDTEDEGDTTLLLISTWLIKTKNNRRKG